MGEQDWLGYAGVITGVIGAITGVVGSALGFVAYRRTDQIKALDLRLELRKNNASLISDGNELLPLVEHAERSRLAVASAKGMYNSGATEKWVSECKGDRSIIESLIIKIPDAGEIYNDLSASELESKLVEIHTLQDKISRFRKKYDDSIASDLLPTCTTNLN